MPEPKHENALDWLRIFAALAVFAHHTTPFFAGKSLVPTAYLAVDLFFLISGFVVAKRYESLLCNGFSYWQFVGSRLIRLMPLLFLAGFICTLEVVTRKIFGSSISNVPNWKITVTVFSTYFSFPSFDNQALGHGTWPLNPPLWSLFFELIVGVLLAPWLMRLRSRYFVFLMAAAMLALITLASKHGGLNSGVFLRDFPTALTRIVVSFGLGVLLYRSKSKHFKFKNYLYFIGVVILSTSIFWLLGGQLALTCGITDTIVILFIWPTVLVFAIRPQQICKIPRARLMGELSYSLYILHWPLMIFIRNLARHLQLMSQDTWITTALISTAVFMISIIAVIFYERPIRTHLRVWLSKVQ